ncbi:MAG: hypothetical protein KBA51_09355, partial [Kiritimatiellae bacterium]|nr:hypothetical protein [Kiritimatiellia bacterium]
MTHTQTLSERIGIPGTAFNLIYRSDRVPGRKDQYTLNFPILGAEIPQDLKRVDVEIEVAGREFLRSLDPEPNLTYTFTWDGTDAYGRPVYGAQPVNVRIGNVYDAVYQEPGDFSQSFSQVSGVPMSGNRSRMEIWLWWEWEGLIGGWDARTQGLGGWTLSPCHAYLSESEELFQGDGVNRSAANVGLLCDRLAGSGHWDPMGDGGPAINAGFYTPRGLDYLPDGSLLIADSYHNCIRKIAPGGIIQTVAGGGPTVFRDDVPATDTHLVIPIYVAAAPDGSYYISTDVILASGADSSDVICKVEPNGIIHRFAGGGSLADLTGDGFPATETRFYNLADIAVLPDGSVILRQGVESKRNYGTILRRITPDGIIQTIAGTGDYGSSGDGGPARLAELRFDQMAAGPDGSIYINDFSSARIRRISPDGIIQTICGRGSSFADGILAKDADIDDVEALCTGPDGSVYFYNNSGIRSFVRRISPDGIISTLGGNGKNTETGDGGLAGATGVRLHYHSAISPQGHYVFPESAENRVRAIVVPWPDYVEAPFRLISADGQEVYHFSETGRHLATVNAVSGVIVYSFEYNSQGWLTAIEDRWGKRTRIERDGEGAPTAIVAPGGQRTLLRLNARGFLEAVENPSGGEFAFTYDEGGLLTSFTDPRGQRHDYEYDWLGFVTRTVNPAGGIMTYSSVNDATGWTVTATDEAGRAASYRTEEKSDGDLLLATTSPAGDVITTLYTQDGHEIITYPDGTKVDMIWTTDPRWDQGVSMIQQITTTLPSLKKSVMKYTRTATLSDLLNPMSLTKLTETRDVNGRVFKTEYDTASRTVTHTSAEGEIAVARLNEQGKLSEISLAPELDPIELTYDPQGRLTQRKQGALQTDITYDAAGRVATVQDAAGAVTRFGYGANDRTEVTTTPLESVFTYGRDASGNPTRLTMPSGASYFMGYSYNGDLTTFTLPGGGGAISRYRDSYGELTNMDLPGGRSVEFQREEFGRPSGLLYNSTRIAYSYAPSGGGCCSSGQLARVSRTGGAGLLEHTIAFTFDSDVLTAMNLAGDAPAGFQFTLDNNAFLTAMTCASGSDTVSTLFTRNLDGFITHYGPFTFERNGPGGMISAISDDAIRCEITYDGLGRIARRAWFSGRTLLYDYT